jgi:glycosyltransferase involved in cell wall biosynthesis
VSDEPAGAPAQRPGLPRIILLFMAVDWPLYMRRPAVAALADAARKHKSTVVAVNRPLCPLSTWFRKPERIRALFGQPRLERLAPNLYLYSPRYVIHDLVAARLPALPGLNLAALRISYRHLQKRLGVAEAHPIVWFNAPEQGYVTRLFPNSFAVFELYDELSALDGRQSPGTLRQEADLRTRVDLLLTTSHALESKYGPHYRQSVMYGNGVSRDSFDRLGSDSVRPLQSLLKIPSPRLGYAGMLSFRMDWSLILRLAELEPDWHFVFVGPIADTDIVQRCRKAANIHFAGAVGHEAMPSVLKAFDVGLLPYHDWPFFHYSNPLKFYEMAAAGLPMVSSAMEELRRFPEAVTVADHHTEAWRESIRAALSRNRSDVTRAGREAVREFLWEDMAERVLDRIARLIP